MEKSSKFHYPPRYPLPMLHPKGENEDLLLFMMPKMHWIAALNGCHRDTDIKAMTVLSPYYK